MLRRARPGPVPADRVRALLARPVGVGWVLPPDPDDGPPWDGTGRLPDPAHVSGTLSGDEPEGTVIDAALAPGSHPAPSPWHEASEPEPLAPVPASVPAAGRPGPLARLAVSLPVGVRTGRLDPGRRGAAALVLAAVLAAVVAGGVVLRGRPQEVALPQVLASGQPLPGVSASPAAGDTVVVSVAGTVRRPGLVRLPAGSRVDDALRAAGGLTDGAATGLLNLARRLVDGEQVLVGVDPPPGAAPVAGAAGSGLLDLNTATVADLDALPGIGPVLAQRIVDWRTEHERFASVDQLREVTGIGEAKFADLEAKVTV